MGRNKPKTSKHPKIPRHTYSDMFYDSIAKGYEKLYGKEQEKKLGIIASNISLSPGSFILDVGCGTASASKFFKARYFGIDKSLGLLRNSRFRKKADLVHGAAEFLPFRDKAFDAVICVTAMHNFEDAGKALSEMARVGKNMFAITLLEKSAQAPKIEKMVREKFAIRKRIAEEKDIILICSNRKQTL